MKLMKPSVIIMSLITALLIVGSIVMVINPDANFYASAVFVAASILYTVIQVVCIIRYRFSFKKIGFYLCHVGMVILMISSFIGWLCIQETSFSIPIDARTAYGVVMRDDGSELDFGFKISITDFTVEKYDPDYQLYRADPDAPGGYELLREKLILSRQGVYDLGAPYGQVKKEDVMDNTGFLDTVALADGLIMAKIPQADKAYAADMSVFDADKKTDVTLRVNVPYTHKGWKFYLMDYDRDNGAFVSLYAKNDPGNIPFAVGLWLVIAGTIVMCFHIFDRKEAA